MRAAAMILVLMFMLPLKTIAEGGVLTSSRAQQDVALQLDPKLRFWKEATVAIAERNPHGAPLPRYRTEIRSRWTKENLYLLFVCPYEELNLKPGPSSSQEVFGLWEWDVAEAFLGTDFGNIRRYKEFEVSPRGEWVDLDIDLSRPHHEDGWTWNSGGEFTARIDRSAKVWYGAMRIPWTALQQQPPSAGEELRVNFYRAQGPRPRRVQVTWQPTMAPTFHVPERFGTMRLTDKSATGSE